MGKKKSSAPPSSSSAIPSEATSEPSAPEAFDVSDEPGPTEANEIVVEAPSTAPETAPEPPATESAPEAAVEAAAPAPDVVSERDVKCVAERRHLPSCGCTGDARTPF